MKILFLIIILFSGQFTAEAKEENFKEVVGAALPTGLKAMMAADPDCSYKSLKGFKELRACAHAEKAGDGVSCPPLTAVKGGLGESCTSSNMKSFRSSLGADALARLKVSKIDSVKYGVHIKPLESVPRHIHSPTSNNAVCASEWVKRKDFVNGFIALYNSKEISASVSFPSGTNINEANISKLDLQLKSTQGMARFLGLTLCA